MTEFAQLVAKWNPRINLVSKGSLADLHDRHIADSIQLYRHIPPEVESWADLGSGGGFPGIILAILAKGTRSSPIEVTLVESDQRKATFLRTASRQLDLAVNVATSRIEDLPPMNAHGLSARALAPLTKLLDYAARHLSPDGFALFPKGETAAKEIATAEADWSFDLEQIPSITNPEAVILKLKRIKRV
ncbi:glucose-inhibited division protein B [Oceanicola granulosus HTCC2516]|uniref:Ribosomal RNA small subunit methyltransferase G n=1 Tax=Oceanicola granulosus (strain ATCC BAA-861 / DSM 15982 / KCTC 12143 / HTCC2516) TaxID=314256 RepID=Q2CJU0_OCEGH|nr:glucose-inhibited division protein B [Oceanicola granulosus HTCC2516]